MEPAETDHDMAAAPSLSDDAHVARRPPADGDSDVGAADDERSLPSATSAKKRGKKSKCPKSMAKRGPTALPKNRGTGFEGWRRVPATPWTRRRSQGGSQSTMPTRP